MAEQILRIRDNQRYRPLETGDTVFEGPVFGAMTGRRFSEIEIESVSLRSPLEVQRFAEWIGSLATHLPGGE